MADIENLEQFRITSYQELEKVLEKLEKELTKLKKRLMVALDKLPELMGKGIKKVASSIQDLLDDAYWPTKMIVPSTEIVHDRANLEVFRGCIRGCRF